MAYFNIHTQQYPLSEQDVRNMYPTMSFSNPFTPPDDWVVQVATTAPPAYDPITQFPREILPQLSPKSSFQYEQAWEIVDLDADTIATNQERAAAQAREAAKAQRAIAVEAITVTTQAGNTFDGDETSQTRMARAIIALQATGTPTVNWVLHDNTVIAASAVELSEALALAGAAQAALWVI